MKTVVVFSGGLDSTALLVQTLVQTAATHALSFYYGQKHQKELEAAAHICKLLKVPHTILNVANIYQGCNSALMQRSMLDIPQKEYAEHSKLDRDAFGAVITSIPARNLLFSLSAMIFAAIHNYSEVVLAVHKNDGDFYAYPDCTPSVLTPFAHSLMSAFDNKIRLHFPFISFQKHELLADTVALYPTLSAVLKHSWSCYEASDKHCGLCATCRERRHAYQRAGLLDPTVYAKEENDADM